MRQTLMSAEGLMQITTKKKTKRNPKTRKRTSGILGQSIVSRIATTTEQSCWVYSLFNQSGHRSLHVGRQEAGRGGTRNVQSTTRSNSESHRGRSVGPSRSRVPPSLFTIAITTCISPSIPHSLPMLSNVRGTDHSATTDSFPEIDRRLVASGGPFRPPLGSFRG